jgi:broad specificity phosphatase PhoE
VTVYLVRHAKAGSRKAWSGDDELRPLSKAGRAQARALAKLLAGGDITRIVSSPYVRCQQTVEPLAHRIGVAVELSDALREGARLADSLRLVEKVASENAVLCTHGDVLGNLLMHYAHLGVELETDRIEKASVWTLEVVDGEVRAARYRPAPRA